MAADDRPHDIFFQRPETGPVGGESDGGALPNGVIRAGQHLKADDRPVIWREYMAMALQIHATFGRTFEDGPVRLDGSRS